MTSGSSDSELLSLAKEAIVELKHLKGDDVEFCVYVDENLPDVGCCAVSEKMATIRELSCSPIS